MSFSLPLGGITTEEFLGAGIFLVSLTGLFVAVRLASSFGYAKRFFLDDCESCPCLLDWKIEHHSDSVLHRCGHPGSRNPCGEFCHVYPAHK